MERKKRDLLEKTSERGSKKDKRGRKKLIEKRMLIGNRMKISFRLKN
jgi:hypothetical protein